MWRGRGTANPNAITRTVKELKAARALRLLMVICYLCACHVKGSGQSISTAKGLRGLASVPVSLYRANKRSIARRPRARTPLSVHAAGRAHVRFRV